VTSGAARPVAVHAEDVTGTWVSELGSRLDLRAAPDGLLSGTYTSAVGSTRDPQPLAGYCSPPAGIMGFVVRWERTGSLAVWAARFGAGQLEATWLLEASGPPATSWRAVHTGHDVFHRVQLGDAGPGPRTTA
jgi:hypothetical protein